MLARHILATILAMLPIALTQAAEFTTTISCYEYESETELRPALTLKNIDDALVLLDKQSRRILHKEVSVDSQADESVSTSVIEDDCSISAASKVSLHQTGKLMVDFKVALKSNGEDRKFGSRMVIEPGKTYYAGASIVKNNGDGRVRYHISTIRLDEIK